VASDPMALVRGEVEPEPYPWQWAMWRSEVPGRDPQSPLQLAQEMVTTDWQVAVAALMHVRTTREQGHPTLWRLLALCPTPWRLMHYRDQSALRAVLKPCGFQNKRLGALMMMSSDWRRGKRPTSPGEVYGCGEYVCDSYMLFVHGDLRRRFDDGYLAAYAVWCNRRRSAGLPYLLEYEEEPNDLEEYATRPFGGGLESDRSG